jgi:hypothetical protein
MSDERGAVLLHASVEDLGPTDSCPLSENVLARVALVGSFSELWPQQFDRGNTLGGAFAVVIK